jgi:hypothetical protein
VQSLFARRRSKLRQRRRQRGYIYVETIIVLPVVFYTGFTIWQLTDMLIASYMVKHAAICAVRAAAVIGPDEPRHYGGEARNSLAAGGQRFADVDEAAWRALQGQTHFKKGGYNVQVSGSFTPNGMIKATVSATYTCLMPGLNAACGLVASRDLKADAEFPYQDANLTWD